ncbi:UNVERIFIED_CONTAM: hypothetical protein FKN15_056960 [Acipenser sinensis]
MGKKSRQRQQKQKLQQQQLEDPASLFPWCSWCGKEDHRWWACPEETPADWCGHCEEDGHNWAGCPYALGQASAATPVAPVPLGSPSSQEIWEWLTNAEGDLCSDLPLAINALWYRDGEQWEAWEKQHHPELFQDIAAMVLNYLAADMGWVPPPPSPPLPGAEQQELPLSPPQLGAEQQELPLFPPQPPWKDSPPLLSDEPAAFPLLSEELAAFPLLSEEPGHPTPRRGEPVHPAPGREEPVHPAPMKVEPESQEPKRWKLKSGRWDGYLRLVEASSWCSSCGKEGHSIVNCPRPGEEEEG